MQSNKFIARVGEIERDIFDFINEHNVVISPEGAAIKNPQALWMAPTWDKVNQHNDRNYRIPIDNGATHFRIISHHHAATASIAAPTRDDMKNLLKNNEKKMPLPYIDLAIGSRVRVTQNIATQIGIFQGAMGTVIGFGYRGEAPNLNTPTGDDMSDARHNNREIPTVFVEMDNEAIPCSIRPITPDNKKPVIPFTAMASTEKIKGKYHRIMLPLAMAHATTVKNHICI